MHSIGRIRLFHLLHLSKPRRDRTIYRTVSQGRIRSILELGLGDCVRALWMIRLAAANSPGERVGYTGMDLFEDRPSKDGPSYPLKEAYRQLRATGAKVRLLPGEPMEALIRSANSLGQFDLVVISAQAAAGATPRAWFFLQRVLGPESLLMVEEDQPAAESDFRPLAPAELQRLATPAPRRKAA